MKFIRLVSADNVDDGILDNEFNQDIKIDEGSQIAYRSLAVDLDPQEFIVDASNNQISFQSNINDAATIGTAKLSSPVTYTTGNAAELLADLQKKTNEALLYNPKNIGTQFQCIIKNGKSRIESNFCPNSVKVLQNNVTGDFGSTLNDATFANNGNISATSSQNNDTNLIFSHQPLGKGVGLFRTRIRNLTDNGGASNTNGFEIGLSDVKPTTWNTTGTFVLPDAQKTYNVRVQKPTDNYQYNDKSGANQDSGIAPHLHLLATRTTNDIIEFVRVGTNLEIRLYRNNQVAFDLLSIINLETEYNGAGEFGVEQPLYPYIILHGLNTTAMLDGYTRCFFDPFVSNINPNEAVTNEDIAQGNEHTELGVRPSDARPVNQNVGRFTFSSSLLAQHLGFDTTVLLSEESGSNFLVHSRNVYTAALTYDNLVVELMNLQVDSYDGLEKGRRNIIATIPANSNANGVIVNEASNLVFIDLDNAQPRYFRNIKARLLYGDLTSVKTIGLTSLTLLIKNKKE